MAFDDKHPGAMNYYPAIVQYKIANARKSRAIKWLAEVEDRKALVDFMFASSNNFVQKMVNSYQEWGGLTPGQEAAVRKAMGQVAERKAAFRTADAASKFIGEVGKRQEFTLTLRAYTSFDGDFGMVHIHILKDAEGNVVVYKGSKHLDGNIGDTLTGKATVKAHNVREGVNQTLISRPVLAVAA